ncbi:bacillaene synthase trans-acting acyltransferase [Tahibacter aquaticus]|uniref:Bacillaene synthase trans-acting acyltransferase n=1 Tax=Tahibacter aquaticus TaxID=520092 RepID=A0A4R6Z0D3_9GAMM|nr:acyltransferase domain-containing protein [Tahibacter aquaticus]TDR44829.1 bacillaene synthase trans-acting acyltransferase [Tahibacter aquaticus]
MRKTVFLFSGQGSQHFQMARALFEHDLRFRAEMSRLDTMVGDLAGHSVIAALYDDANEKSRPFDALELSHPAIFMVEYALAQTLIAAGIRPDLCLGTSLGSFAAAAVAGFIDVEQALAAVIQQAAALEACCEAGTMIAVLADTAVFERERLHELAELAAINFAAHFVVAAPRERVAELEGRLKAGQIAFQRLPVAFAFHSRWIDAAQAPFASFAQSLRSGAGRLPLICCDQAAVLQALPGDFFWQVVRRPIRFGAAVAMLEREHSGDYIDLGPSGTLATFLRYLLPAERKPAIHAVLSPFGNDQARLAALVAGWPRPATG